MAFRVSTKVVKASRTLCVKVINHYGAAAIANSLGLKRQYVHKWVVQGYIPLVQVWNVSRLLKVPQWSLSYHKLAEVFGEDSPKIVDVIKKSPLYTEQKQEILSLLK